MLTAVRNALKALARSCGYTIRRVDNTQFFDFDALLYYQLQRRGVLCFIQIGACDGVSFDPIYRFVTRNHARVRGVVVEPLPDLFQQLQRNYRRYTEVVAINCAVHNTETEMVLHRVDPARLKDVPGWARGIASFDPHHHHRSGIPTDCMIAERVRCQPLSEILKSQQMSRVDLLQIDTEGYDAEIVLGIDFREIAPQIIRFEHGLQSGTMTGPTFQSVVERLHDNGYELMIEASDAIAYRRDLIVGNLPPSSATA
jgi:FkbM family methyltransferase